MFQTLGLLMQLTDAALVSVPLPVMYSNTTWLKPEALHLLFLLQPAEQGTQAVLVLWPSSKNKHFTEKGKFQFTHRKSSNHWSVHLRADNPCCWLLRPPMCSAAMKATSEKKILFSGKEYLVWPSQILKKKPTNFHCSFKISNKLDEDLYQNKASKHLWLLGSVAN